MKSFPTDHWQGRYTMEVMYFCLSSRIYNFFLSLLFFVTLVVVLTNVSQTILPGHVYKIAMCANEIHTDETNTADSNFECKNNVIRAQTEDTFLQEHMTPWTENDDQVLNGTTRPDFEYKDIDVSNELSDAEIDDLEENEFFRIGVAKYTPQPIALNNRKLIDKKSKASKPVLVSNKDEFRQFEKYVNESIERENREARGIRIKKKEKEEQNNGEARETGIEELENEMMNIADITLKADSAEIANIESEAKEIEITPNIDEQAEKIKITNAEKETKVVEERIDEIETGLKNMEMKQKSEIKPAEIPKHIPVGTKQMHFGFLKVHKAGSTTIQNIFFRFGLRNNLTFVLPIKGHYLGRAKQVLPVQKGKHFDVLSNHIRNFKGHFFKRFLPKDSINIAIIREPLDRMISAAFYYREVWNKKYLINIPRGKFIQNLIRQTNKYETSTLSRTKNSMGLDFGFPKNIDAKDTKYIKWRMGRLMKRFSLVLVMERFDESLILLKRLMNWDISDVMYLPTNSHAHKESSLSPNDKAKFKKINFLDYVIYNTFNQVLDAKVKAAGTDFKEEVKHFKSVLQLAKGYCDEEDVNAPALMVPASKWNSMFTFPFSECNYINMEELDFVAKLKERHVRMHNVPQNIVDQIK